MNLDNQMHLFAKDFTPLETLKYANKVRLSFSSLSKEAQEAVIEGNQQCFSCSSELVLLNEGEIITPDEFYIYANCLSCRQQFTREVKILKGIEVKEKEVASHD